MTTQERSISDCLRSTKVLCQTSLPRPKVRLSRQLSASKQHYLSAITRRLRCDECFGKRKNWHNHWRGGYFWRYLEIYSTKLESPRNSPRESDHHEKKFLPRYTVSPNNK